MSARIRSGAAADRDRGAILVLVLMMTVILGVMVVGVARYAAVGLRSTRVTEARNLRTGAVDGGLRMGIELVKSAPAQCTASMSVPPLNGLAITLSCAANGSASATWVPYRLTATTAGGGSAVADLQVSKVSGVACTAACTVTINSWSISS